MQVLFPTSGAGVAALRAAAAPVPASPSPQPTEPTETFGRGVLRESKEMAVKVGNISGMALGGALGLASLTLGLYAGVAGGAIFLGALGAGFGPIIASVSTHGLLSFIGTSFSTMGLAARTGVVVGGLATGVGAFSVGQGIGQTVGVLPGMAVGGAIGLVTGVVHQTQRKAGGDQ